MVREMLDVAKKEFEFLTSDELIDLFSTDYRHIDGIQRKIKDIIENLPELKEKNSPFEDWIKGKTDTSEKFYECLKKFCAKNPLVLAFDTFENLEKVASDWLFKDETDGLQVPGLICIVAGRDKEKIEIDTYRNNPLVTDAYLTGFSDEQAEDFYQKIVEENKVKDSRTQEEKDPFDDLLRAAGLPKDKSLDSINWVLEITNGHPLRLEMVFQWLGTLLGDESLKDLTEDKFDERLMLQVRELAGRGQLDAGAGKRVSQPVYDTLLCMAHITRRFNEDFLQYFIEKKLIQQDDPNVTPDDIIKNLERYFFVKVRQGRAKADEDIYQLHDELARLVREYVWPYQDNSGEKKEALLGAVDQYYDLLISERLGEEADILRVEQLYYRLQRDWEEAGKHLWFELAEMGSENINKFLPSEIEKYLESYDIENRVAFHIELARMESKAHHRNQARIHWEQVMNLGEAEGRDDWVVDALVGKFNTYVSADPEKAHQEYLLPAKELAEAKVPDRLATIYYEIGYAHRWMQKIDDAVEWYGKALAEQRKRPTDRARKATVLNDRGYAYTFLGRWGFTTRDVENALQIRQSILRDERERLEKANPEEREKLQRVAMEAARKVGMSHNTLGDFGRYTGHLDNALNQYTDALKLFREAKDTTWQAKALCGMGETYRRLALDANERGNVEARDEFLGKALENMQSSLYLCQKYQIDGERDTALRRLGRYYHDLALLEMKREKNRDTEFIKKNLRMAHEYFEEALKYALKTNDDLEEFENLTEMAFLLNDAIEVLGEENVPDEFKNALVDLEKALKEHKKDKLRIYQYPVFEYLLRMEKAAIDFVHGLRTEAMDEYLDVYKGLATLPGYGVARYVQHRDHLKEQVEKLSPEEQIKRCDEIIEIWETTPVPGSKPERVLADDYSDLVEWSYLQLDKLNKA